MAVTLQEQLFSWLSTDTKPAGVQNGAQGFEFPSMKDYFFYEGIWYPKPHLHLPATTVWTEALVGTGSTIIGVDWFQIESGTTASSTAIRRNGNGYTTMAGVQYDIIDWTKAIVFEFMLNSYTQTSTGIARVTLGKATGAGYANPGVRSIGVRVSNLTLEGIVHDGTSLTAFGSLVLTDNITYAIRLLSDGAGNVQLFSGSTRVGTTAAGPSTTGTAGDNTVFLETGNGANAAAYNFMVGNVRFGFGS